MFLRGSLIEDELRDCLTIYEEQYSIFGDDDVLRPWFQVANTRTTETVEQRLFITPMSSMPETSKWIFKDLKQICTRNDFSRTLKEIEAPIFPYTYCQKC